VNSLRFWITAAIIAVVAVSGIYTLFSAGYRQLFP